MTARLKVAVFTDNDFDKVNGVTTVLSAMLARVPADLSVRVYTASRLGVDHPDYLALASWGVGIPYYGEMQMYWPPYRRLIRRLRADGVQLIHVTTPGPLGIAAVLAARHLGLPLVGSFHTDLAQYTTLLSGRPALGAFMRHFMRWLYQPCRRVLTPSTATSELLVAAGMPAAQLAVWGRGVDTDLFNPDRRSAWLRAAWRADDTRPVLMYVGRISEEKGVRQLPALHDELQRLGHAHRLVVIGDGPLRAEIARQCPDAVCPGTIGKESLADAYASADVFVFPSTTDTAGNVVLEAQSSGLPVVVSDVGGPKEQMRAGETGLVCGNAPGEWTSAIARLLDDSGGRRAMGRAARAFAMTRTWEATLTPLFDTYRAMAATAVAHAQPVDGSMTARQVA